MKLPIAIGTDAFSILLLLYTMYLAKKNSLVNSVKTKYYLRSAFVVCLIMIFEIFDVILNNMDARFRGIRMLVNVIAFSISPLVPLFITFLHNERLLKYKKYFSIPFWVITALSVSTWKTRWIFYVDENNDYFRGSYFWIYPVIMFACLILLIWSDYENYKKYEKDEIVFLYSLYSIIIIGTAIQLSNPKWLLIWTSTSIALLLYYIFLRELQFKLDPMTEIYNRSVFQKDLSRIGSRQGVGIIMIDINKLKDTNDQFGHAVGDEMIIKAAEMINRCFETLGKAYRIGGDEFCIICENSSDEKIQRSFSELDAMVLNSNKNYKIEVSMARGYCIYDPRVMRDIYEAFSIADRRMYSNKALIKVQEENLCKAANYQGEKENLSELALL